MTVEKLLNSLSSDEITHWMAFFQLEKEDREHSEMTAKTKSQARGR